MRVSYDQMWRSVQVIRDSDDSAMKLGLNRLLKKAEHQVPRRLKPPWNNQNKGLRRSAEVLHYPNSVIWPAADFF